MNLNICSLYHMIFLSFKTRDDAKPAKGAEAHRLSSSGETMEDSAGG